MRDGEIKREREKAKGGVAGHEEGSGRGGGKETGRGLERKIMCDCVLSARV